MSGGYIISNQREQHFVTLTIVGWVGLFNQRKYCEVLIGSIRFYMKNQGLKVHAYVIMSNHLHAIISASEAKNDLSSIIGRLKSYTSKQFFRKIEKSNDHRKEWMMDIFDAAGKKNSRNTGFQIWIQNNHPVELSNRKILKRVLDYIHENPVKKGIVEFPWHYMYSSARQYAGLPGILNLDLLDVSIEFDV
jgi:REP-associated tyrosine transposase